jgi:hypothetical protein
VPRRCTEHTVTWQHPLTERHHVLRLTVTRDYLVAGNTHLELHAGKGEPHPLSSTGYRSHFLDSDALVAAGGAVAYVTAWIAREMPQFLQRDLQARQGNLFARADAREATTAAARKPARSSAPSRRRPAAGPSRG